MPRRSDEQKRNRDDTIAAKTTPNDLSESSSPVFDFMFDERVVAQDSLHDAEYLPDEEI